MEDKKVDIKAMLPSELAQLYEVSPKTLHNWLKDLKKTGELKRNGSKYYTPKQVKYIFDFLGYPK